MDFVLAQQKKPQKEKQEALLKLAEHMGCKKEEPQFTLPPAHPKNIPKVPKGIRGKLDEIRSQRSEITLNKKAPQKHDDLKYGDSKIKRSHSKGGDIKSEVQSIPTEHPAGKEKVIVNEKFNLKELLL